MTVTPMIELEEEEYLVIERAYTLFCSILDNTVGNENVNIDDIDFPRITIKGIVNNLACMIDSSSYPYQEPEKEKASEPQTAFAPISKYWKRRDWDNTYVLDCFMADTCANCPYDDYCYHDGATCPPVDYPTMIKLHDKYERG